MDEGNEKFLYWHQEVHTATPILHLARLGVCGKLPLNWWWTCVRDCHVKNQLNFSLFIVLAAFIAVGIAAALITSGKHNMFILKRLPILVGFWSLQMTDVNHKPDGRLPLLSARPAVTPASLKRAATNFAAWWTETQRVWTVCRRLLPDSVATAFEPGPFLCLSPAR